MSCRHVSITPEESRQILERVKAKRQRTKTPTKEFGNFTSHMNHEIARLMVKKILDYYLQN